METPPRAILFQWQETLLDLNATRSAFLLVQWQCFLDELLHIPVKNYIDTVLQAYADCGTAQSAYLKACQTLRLPTALAEELAHHALEHQAQHPRLCPGAINLLRVLSRSYQIGLLAPGKASQLQQELLLSGLGTYVHETVTTESEGFPLNDPQLIQRLLKKMGIRVSEAVLLAATAERGLCAGGQLGMRLIWKRDKPGETTPVPAPCAIVDELRDLPHALRDLAGVAAG